MYHSRRNPLKKVSADSEVVETARAGKVRKLHKAFLRWHDPDNWPLLREALQRMGRADLIGSGPHCLIPRHQPARHKPAPGAGQGARLPAGAARRGAPPVAPAARPRGGAKPSARRGPRGGR
jgi:hypothetical protein